MINKEGTRFMAGGNGTSKVSLIGVGKGRVGWVENLKFEVKLFMP